MATVNLTNDIKKRFIASFREIFARDTDFTYNKDDMKNSHIIITAKYASPEAENLLPQIVVSTVGYSTQPTSFYGNYAGMVVNPTPLNPNGLVQECKALVPFSCTFDVMSSNKPECELVADKVFNAVVVEYPWAFDSLGLQIQAINVGEAIPKEQYPRYSFISTVTVSGMLVLNYTDVPPIDKKTLLENIRFTLKNI